MRQRKEPAYVACPKCQGRRSTVYSPVWDAVEWCDRCLGSGKVPNPKAVQK